MGFERDEVPSRVKGSALVGQGKAQKPCTQFFSRRLKRARPTSQGTTRTGFERDEIPSRDKGSALVGQGKAQKPCTQFFSRRLKRARPPPKDPPKNGIRKGRSPFAGQGQRPCGSGQSPEHLHAIFAEDERVQNPARETKNGLRKRPQAKDSPLANLRKTNMCLCIFHRAGKWISEPFRNSYPVLPKQYRAFPAASAFFKCCRAERNMI